MNDDQWLESQPLTELVADLAQEAVKKYRIERSDATQMILDEFESNPSLKRAVDENETAQKLKRTGSFKKAASAAKKRIYYHLRNYRNDAQQLERLIKELEHASLDTPIEYRQQLIDAVVLGHASTRERIPSRDEFYRQLSGLIPPPTHIIDIGCGVHPLMFPFEGNWSTQIARYVAVDKNPNDVSCINHFSRLSPQAQLSAIQWEISEGWPALAEQTGCEQFDIAFIMKVVPVVRRQQRDLLSVLSQTPAKSWLLTGSRVAMAKRRSIEKREQRVLEEFVALAGRTVKHEFVVEEEFAWIVEE